MRERTDIDRTNDRLGGIAVLLTALVGLVVLIQYGPVTPPMSDGAGLPDGSPVAGVTRLAAG